MEQFDFQFMDSSFNATETSLAINNTVMLIYTDVFVASWSHNLCDELTILRRWHDDELTVKSWLAAVTARRVQFHGLELGFMLCY